MLRPELDRFAAVPAAGDGGQGAAVAADSVSRTDKDGEWGVCSC